MSPSPEKKVELSKMGNIGNLNNKIFSPTFSVRRDSTISLYVFSRKNCNCKCIFKIQNYIKV